MHVSVAGKIPLPIIVILASKFPLSSVILPILTLLMTFMFSQQFKKIEEGVLDETFRTISITLSFSILYNFCNKFHTIHWSLIMALLLHISEWCSGLKISFPEIFGRLWQSKLESVVFRGRKTSFGFVQTLFVKQ